MAVLPIWFESPLGLQCCPSSRLATAYSLEKMRRALDKLRRSVDNENHLMRNTIEPESEENALDSNYWLIKKSVKKEQAEQQAE